MSSVFLLDENIKSKLDILGHDVKREIFKYTKHPIAESIPEYKEKHSIGYFFSKRLLTMKKWNICCRQDVRENYIFPKHLKFMNKGNNQLLVESDFDLPFDTFDLYLYNIYKYYNYCKF